MLHWPGQLVHALQFAIKVPGFDKSSAGNATGMAKSLSPLSLNGRGAIFQAPEQGAFMTGNRCRKKDSVTSEVPCTPPCIASKPTQGGSVGLPFTL